jgi:hypothetical protein
MFLYIIGLLGAIIPLVIHHFRQRFTDRPWFTPVINMLVYSAAILTIYVLTLNYHSKQRLEETLEARNPYKQPILTVSCATQVFESSNDNERSNYPSSGGYMHFMKDNMILVTLSSSNSERVQTGNGHIAYFSRFSLDAPITNRTISFLRNSDSIRIYFQIMRSSIKIIGGISICSVNSFFSLTFPITGQIVKDDKIIIISDIGKLLEVLSDKK